MEFLDKLAVGDAVLVIFNGRTPSLGQSSPFRDVLEYLTKMYNDPTLLVPGSYATKLLEDIYGDLGDQGWRIAEHEAAGNWPNQLVLARRNDIHLAASFDVDSSVVVEYLEKDAKMLWHEFDEMAAEALEVAQG
jgi:hypothetical protein